MRNNENFEKKYIPESGKRMQDVINEKNINLTQMSKVTGISRSTIYSFVYNGTDISSLKLAKLCDYCNVSTDYILGLSINRHKRHIGKMVQTAVYQGDNCIGIFPSLSKAAEFVGVKTGVASRVLNGIYKTTRGIYSFKEVAK